MFQHPIQAVACRWVADGGDAVTEPEFKHIFGVGPLRLPANVTVHVDEAGHQKHSLAIQFFVAGFGLRTAFGVNRNAGVAHLLNLSNSVFLDHNIDRPNRGRTRTVNERYSPDNEPVVRAVPFAGFTGRGFFNLRCKQMTNEK